MKPTLCRSPADVEQLAVEMKAACEKYSEEYCANRGKNLSEFGQWMVDVGLTRVIDIVKNGNEMHFSICLSKDGNTYTLSMLQMSEAGRATVPDEWANIISKSFFGDEAKEEKSPTLTRYFTMEISDASYKWN